MIAGSLMSLPDYELGTLSLEPSWPFLVAYQPLYFYFLIMNRSMSIVSKPATQALAAVLGLGVLLPTLTSGPRALAQVPSDSGRIEDQLPVPTPPPADSDITVPPSDDLTPPPGAEDQKFQLQSLEIEGSTVYTTEELAPFYQEFVGQEISLKDLYDVANQVTQQYRDDGYILSVALVPEQTISDGAARLQVIEGYVETVEFEGATPRQEKRLQGFGKKIMAQRPLNIKRLERALLLVNDLAGTQVRSVLSRGSSQGAAVLTAKVDYDPLDAFVDLSNRGTDEVGPLRIQAGLFLNTATGEQITLRGATSPFDPEELGFGRVEFDLPVGHDGWEVEIGTGFTAVQPEGDLEAFDIFGRTFTADVGVSYPLVRSRRTNVRLNSKLDFLDSRSTTRFTGVSEPISRDQLVVWRAGVSVDRRDRNGQTQVSAELSQGLGGTTPSNATEPLSRAQGSAVFTKAAINLSRTQRLPGKLNLALSGTAQATADDLLVSEQFGLGGSQFGSAFDPDEVLGDSGYGLRAELQRPFFYQASDTNMVTQPYVFVDYGQVFRETPTAVENGSDALSSAGLGVRQTIGDSLSASLELAFPVKRTDQSTSNSPRLFFSITSFF